jgi:DNA-directed RNA polymerase alpha subunit
MIQKLNLPLAQTGLSMRTLNHLENRNIMTVNDLLHCRRCELSAIPYVGEAALEEIVRALAQLGVLRRSATTSQRAAQRRAGATLASVAAR